MEVWAAIGAIAGLVGMVFSYFTGAKREKKKIRKQRSKEAAAMREAVGSGDADRVNAIVDKLCRGD